MTQDHEGSSTYNVRIYVTEKGGRYVKARDLLANEKVQKIVQRAGSLRGGKERPSRS